MLSPAQVSAVSREVTLRSPGGSFTPTPGPCSPPPVPPQTRSTRARPHGSAHRDALPCASLRGVARSHPPLTRRLRVRCVCGRPSNRGGRKRRLRMLRPRMRVGVTARPWWPAGPSGGFSWQHQLMLRKLRRCRARPPFAHAGLPPAHPRTPGSAGCVTQDAGAIT